MDKDTFKIVDWPEDGRYVLALSGGVDSVVLLDLLSNSGKDYELILAHLDHGIRDDSEADRRFTEELAGSYGYEFRFKEVGLGKDASEEEAREARYDFLFEVLNKTNARSLITAHHKNDLIETAIHNLLRGTFRSGVSSLSSNEKIKRPLLELSKEEIRSLAAQKRLEWVEDETNRSLKYKRNYIRHVVIPKAISKKSDFLEEFYKQIKKISKLNNEIDRIEYEVFPMFIKKSNNEIELERKDIINLDALVSKELIVYTLKQHTKASITEERINNAWLFIKTAKPGSVFQFDKHTEILCKKDVCIISRK